VSGVPTALEARHDVPTPARRVSISLPVLALALLTGFLLGNVAAYLQTAWSIIRYPYDVDYGEGIVWQQMIDMMHGHAYGPLGVFPAIVYHYPPLYHVTVGSLSAIFGLDALQTGRTVSLLATLASGAAITWLVAQVSPERFANKSRLMAGAIGGLLFISGVPTIQWAATMRVDMLAGLFSLIGLALAIRSIERPRLIFVAAFVFNLAVYTKQMSIAAPAAAFLGLLAVRPRQAWLLLGSSLVIGVIALTPLYVATNGGFLRHVIAYNINRSDSSQFRLLVEPIECQLILVLLAIAGVGSLVLSIRRRWPIRSAESSSIGGGLIVVSFLLLKTLMLATITKSGAATNYMLEWTSALAICCGVAIVPAVSAALEPAKPDHKAQSVPVLSVALLLALCLQAAILPRWPSVEPALSGRAAALDKIVALIRATSRPVISDDMTLLIRAGRRVQWEPSIAAELANTGRYDEKAFVRMVREGRFGFFVTFNDRGSRVFDSRYDPAVAEAIHAAYPVERTIAGLILHLPAAGAPRTPRP
jgi:hypothetical protein